MTTIIDGIDVGGCLYYNNDKCLNDKMMQSSCKNVASCYYKECKRTEQEYKELLIKLGCPTTTTARRKVFTLEQQLKRKEQECEELKKQLTILDDEDVVVEITVKQFEEYKKLKQTLAEIRDIATCCIEGDVARIRMKQILQKINEVEDD